jgi:hypothetical protein
MSTTPLRFSTAQVALFFSTPGNNRVRSALIWSEQHTIVPLPYDGAVTLHFVVKELPHPDGHKQPPTDPGYVPAATVVQAMRYAIYKSLVKKKDANAAITREFDAGGVVVEKQVNRRTGGKYEKVIIGEDRWVILVGQGKRAGGVSTLTVGVTHHLAFRTLCSILSYPRPTGWKCLDGRFYSIDLDLTVGSLTQLTSSVINSKTFSPAAIQELWLKELLPGINEHHTYVPGETELKTTPGQWHVTLVPLSYKEEPENLTWLPAHVYRTGRFVEQLTIGGGGSKKRTLDTMLRPNPGDSDMWVMLPDLSVIPQHQYPTWLEQQAKEKEESRKEAARLNALHVQEVAAYEEARRTRPKNPGYVAPLVSEPNPGDGGGGGLMLPPPKKARLGGTLDGFVKKK